MKTQALVIRWMFIGLSLCLEDVFSQSLPDSVHQDWVVKYNSEFPNSLSFATDIGIDPFKNVYVTGYSGAPPDYAFITVKYASNGTRQWIAQYKNFGFSDHRAQALVVDSAGNVYVTGYSFGANTYVDYATIKYNPDGIQQWVARYSGSGGSTDLPRAIAVDQKGNVYVTGESFDTSQTWDYATVKYGADGAEKWVARYNGSGNSDDRASRLSLDSQGNVYVMGSSIGQGTQYDYALVKYDPPGNQQWVARYNGNANGNDYAYAFAMDRLGHSYIAGVTADTASFRGVTWTIAKFDASGVLQWTSGLAGIVDIWSGADPIALALDDSLNIYVAGSSFSLGSRFDFLTLKFDPSGVLIWKRFYTYGTGSDRPVDMSLDSRGNIFVTGGSAGEHGGGFATLSYDRNGNVRWVARLEGPEHSPIASSALVVDNSGSIYVTGSGKGTMVTVKYSPLKPTNVVAEAKEAPEIHSLSQNFPNPFNPSTTIQFSLAAPGYASLKIYNTFGEEVATVVASKLNAGRHIFKWDATGFASGVYLYRLQTESFVETRKLLFLQ